MNNKQKNKSIREIVSETHRSGGLVNVIAVLTITAFILLFSFSIVIGTIAMVLAFSTLLVYAIWGFLTAGGLVTITPNWIGSFGIACIFYITTSAIRSLHKESK